MGNNLIGLKVFKEKRGSVVMKKKIAIGASCYTGEYLIPKMLPNWQRVSNNSELKVEIGDSESIFEQVLSGDLEVGLIGACFEHDDLETREFLLNDELILIAPPNHHLAQKTRVLPEDLKGQNFIIREPGSATRMWMRESFAKYGISFDDLNIIAEFDTHRAILSAVESGVGLACLPKLIAKELLDQKKIKRIDVDGLSPITGSICTIWNRQYLSSEGEELLSFLDSEKRKIKELVEAA